MADTATTIPISTTRQDSRRDRLYELLRDAGPEGVWLHDIASDIPCAAVHVESLIFEGHRIESEAGPIRKGQRFGRRWILVRDAWA